MDGFFPLQEFLPVQEFLPLHEFFPVQEFLAEQEFLPLQELFAVAWVATPLARAVTAPLSNSAAAASAIEALFPFISFQTSN
jgi:hypothetical protein